jgi:uncharacterized protein YukE
MTAVLAPVSPGELLDKVTILTIKANRMTGPAQLANVESELAALRACWANSSWAKVDVRALEQAMLRVNQALWDIEDRIRDKERAKEFDAEFIELARAVYLENDKRAQLKRRLNLDLGSAIVEEKSYSKY